MNRLGYCVAFLCVASLAWAGAPCSNSKDDPKCASDDAAHPTLDSNGAPTKNDSKADFERAFSLLRGEVSIERDAEAKSLILRAAEAGYPPAEAALSIAYQDGAPRLGIGVDAKQALHWMTRAAEHGQQHAQLALGMEYIHGDIVASDKVMAETWLTRAAEQGDAAMRLALGDMFEQGDGVTRSLEKAFRWYEDSATMGERGAQARVASMHLDGRGTARDAAQAYFFATLAARAGEPSAEALRAKAEEALDTPTRVRMEERAAQWTPRAPPPTAGQTLFPEVETPD